MKDPKLGTTLAGGLIEDVDEGEAEQVYQNLNNIKSLLQTELTVTI